MKKMFVGVLLASAAIVGCGAKKASTTPSTQDKALQESGDGTGGAMYGGATPEPAAKGTANPCATQ